MSAFHPVIDTNNYFVYNENSLQVPLQHTPSQSKSISVSSEENCKPKRNFNKKKWTKEQKKQALLIAKQYGVKKGLIHLQQNQPKEFYYLSISTLQYWYKQTSSPK